MSSFRASTPLHLPTSPTSLRRGPCKLALSTIGAVLAALLVAPAAGAHAPAAQPEVAEFEVEFLTGMIDHHQMALHMSDLCLDKAVHAEVLKMMELENLSGAGFEIAFLQMMSEHQAMPVEDGSECLRRAGHSELRSLCGDIVATQLREIAQMEAWLCRWYGDCRFTYLRSS